MHFNLVEEKDFLVPLEALEAVSSLQLTPCGAEEWLLVGG